MKKIILFLLLFVSVVLYGANRKPRTAKQNSEKSQETEKKAENPIETSTVNVVDSATVIFYCDSVIDQWRKIHEEDSIKYEGIKDIMKDEQLSAQRTQHQLQDSIQALHKQITDYEAMLRFDDECLISLAVHITTLPFREKRVNEAISLEDKIFYPLTKKAYSYVFKILRDYKVYHQELSLLVKQAQTDELRTNDFKVEEYKNIYIQKFKNTEYYRNYRAKKQELPLPELDALFDKIMERLNKHCREKHATFFDLME